MSCCNNSCDPDHEPLPSTVDNFVTQFFGEVTKTCVDGQVVWELPCNLDEGIPGYPRVEGEGLACYFSRVLEDISMGGGGGGPVDALLRANNLSDLTNVPTARTNLGLGTMATQNATNVAITGGTISNAQIVNPTITGATINTSNVTGGTITGAAVKSLPAPVLSGDAATKAYADAAAAGLSVLSPVRVATIGANINLTGGAPDTLDTILLAPNDRVLVKDQSTPSQNGVYYVQTLGTGSNGTWARTTDADTTGELVTGTYVFVNSGATNSSTSFVITTTGVITIGTTPITWTQYFSVGSISFSSITGSVVAGQIASVNAASIIGSITAGQIGSINANTITGLITSTQIGSVNANTIVGGITATQINDVNAATIVGSISASQIGSVSAGSITGVIVGAQLTDQILNTQRLIASDISVVRRVSTLPTLPNVNYPIGALALNTTNQTLYQNVANVWTVVTSSSSVTGTLTATDIASVNAGSIVGLIIASQIGTVSAASITGSISSSQIGSVSATAITGTITSSQISSVSAASIVGGITSSQISSVSAGSITGGITSSQITSVNAASLTGTVSAAQIGSVNATTITIGTLVDSQISSVSAGKLIAGTIGAQEIILSNSASSILRSDNYSAGASGWRIRGNGDGEFNNVTVRGTFSAGTGADGVLNASPSASTFGNSSFRHIAFPQSTVGSTEFQARNGGTAYVRIAAFDIGSGATAGGVEVTGSLGGSTTLGPGGVTTTGTIESLRLFASSVSVDAKDCNIRVMTGATPTIVLNRDLQQIWINGQKVVASRYTGPVTTLADVIACLQYHGLCN